MYIVENPDPDQIYYFEFFGDKKDEKILMHEIEFEPETINWENMDAKKHDTKKRLFYSSLVSFLLIASMVGLMYLF